MKEVRFALAGKTCYALGFKNDSGGYELRNKNFKGSGSPKDIRFIENGSNTLAVFEGFFDFLSYRSLYYKQQGHLGNFLVLNSASFFEKSLQKL